LFFFVMPGLGMGFLPAGSRAEVSSRRADDGTDRPVTVENPGTALAPFHLGLELGATIVRGFSLSLLGRFQLVTASNVEPAATSALAGLLRARYRFLGGRFHPYAHLDVGGGEIRYLLDVSKPLGCTDAPCRDSVRLGYLFAGGGGGLWIDAWRQLAFIVDVSLLGAIPVGGGQAGMSLDVQVGLGASFM
jgi:hypothetical protein